MNGLLEQALRSALLALVLAIPLAGLPFSAPAAVLTVPQAVNPVLVGTWTGMASAVAVKGTYAYVGSDTAGLEIIDVSDPAAPRRISGWALRPVRDVAVSGNHAYLASETAGLHVIDVSNPTTPVWAGGWNGGGFFPPPGFAYAVSVSGNYAYVADLYWLEVIDVSNPAAPINTFKYSPSWTHPPGTTLQPRAVAAFGKCACVIWDYAGRAVLDVIDVGQPAAPAWAGSLDFSGPGRAVALDGQYGYLAAGSKLEVVDVSRPAQPTRVGGLDTRAQANWVAVSGNYAYLAEGTNGLEVIDVSNATAPSRVGGVPINGPALAVAVSGDCAYVAAGDGGLVILRVSQTVPGTAPVITTAPESRRVVAGSSVTFNVNATGAEPLAYQWRKDGVDCAGGTNSSLGLLRVQGSDAGSYTVIVSNASGAVTSAPPAVLTVLPAVRLTLAGTWTGVASAVTVRGPYAYVGSGTSGLEVIGVSDAAAPVRIGGTVTGGRANHVAVSGNCAYVAGGGNGLEVIEVSAPNAPTRLGGLAIEGALTVAVSGTYAYVIGTEGLKVVDVSQPSAPRLVSDWPGSGAPFCCFDDVALSGQYAYVAFQNVDFWAHMASPTLGVLDVTNPAGPALAGSWAGPFSPSVSALGVAVAEQYAYLTDGTSGLKVIEVGNGGKEVGSCSYQASGSPRGVAVSGNHVYLADGPNGLRVIDVSNPAGPVHAAIFQTPNPALEVAVSGDYAYVATGPGGLVILRILITDTPGSTPVPLVFSAQPYGLTATEGGEAAFQVAVLGMAPPSYQWRFQGVALPGATNAVLILANVRQDQTGSYDVVVTNDLGAVTSRVAVLKVRLAGPSNPELLACWTFDGGTTTTALDDGPSQIHATIVNAAKTPGVDGRALAFDGASSYLDVPSHENLNFAGPITLAAWVRPASRSGLQNILAHGYADQPPAEVCLRLREGFYEVGSWNGVTANLAWAPMPGSDLKTWVHLAGVYDGAKWMLYRNGKLAQQTAASFGAVPVQANWAIGARAGDTERFFAGGIDEVRIYWGALSAEAVADLFAAKWRLPGVLWENSGNYFGYSVKGAQGNWSWQQDRLPVCIANWKVVSTADFTGDGYPDVLFQHTLGFYSVALWAMEGTQTTSAAVLAYPDEHWKVVGTGDFDSDGYTDLLWQHDGGWLGIVLIKGANATTAAQWVPLGRYYYPDTRIVGVADLTGDGQPDIVWQNPDPAFGVGVWPMDGTNIVKDADGQPVGTALGPMAGRDWWIVATGDFTHDGHTDLLLRYLKEADLEPWQQGGLELWTVEGAPPVARKLARLAESSDMNWRLEGFFPSRLPTNVKPLAVRLTSPQDGATVTAPADLTITVELENPGLASARVEFFEGNQSLGAAFAAPYSCAWHGAVAGTYVFTAKATDALGWVVHSPAAVVTVK